jgi:uncharacterized protein (TIGR00255 family)
MTGFASVSRDEGGERAAVTIKSVNHRFLDISIKAPSVVAALEPRLRAAVQQRVTRGRVEVAIAVETAVAEGREVVLDEALLARMVDVLRGARAKGLIAGDLEVSDLLRLPQVLEIRVPALTEHPVAQPDGLAERLVHEALEELVRMRETEGRFLAADLDARAATIGRLVTSLEEQSRGGQQMLESRLRERLANLPADLQGDPAAAAQEIVRFVARSDIDEEVVRLRGHLDHWRALSAGPEPCGRKLDFLVQEMNREINTIGSKVEGLWTTALVIEAKAELERVREQVQNVE